MRSGAHGGLICPLEKGVGGIETSHQMPGRSWRAGKPGGDGKPGGLMCPLEKGDRGIETSGSGYLRQQIRGGRKGRAERHGLGQSPNKITRLGGLRRSSEPQEAFVNDNETVEAEALEDAEAGVTVTVAVPRYVTVPRESVTEQEAASELHEASELEEARERTMT